MNINGNATYAYGQGGVIAIVSIIMVFAILLLIIVLTELVSKAVPNDKLVEQTATQNYSNNASPLNANDEDAMVACLVAAIDYRNETKKHIEVKSVREVK